LNSKRPVTECLHDPGISLWKIHAWYELVYTRCKGHISNTADETTILIILGSHFGKSRRNMGLYTLIVRDR
jgi:hypothetical protein